MRKLKTVSMLVLFFAVILTTTACASDTLIEFYEELADEGEYVQIYTPDELTADVLNNRSGEIIIEKIISECVKDGEDGKILNSSSKNKYIGYKDFECKKGDIIASYIIFNPESMGFDDVDNVLLRCDYVILEGSYEH